jgi:ABC-2 type transport system permease protein
MRLLAVARKEALQFRRDRRSLTLAFALPLLLLLIFGYAITWDVEDIPMAVLDHDSSARSRGLVDAFQAAGRFRVVERLDREARIASLVERGVVRLVLVIPADFSESVTAGGPAPVQAVLDGSDANTATIVLNYAEATVRAWALRAAPAGVPVRVPLVVASRVWYNEQLESRNMIVPGLIAVIMMIIAAMLTSGTIAREWERGTMEQLVATPVSRFEVVLGKLLPYVVIGLADVAATTVLGVVVFGVPFRGNVLLYSVLTFFFLLGSLGLGIFISAATRSQLLATQVAMIATFLPAYLLSGFMFPVDVMPAPLRAITYIVPARYYIVVTRGIFLKDVGLDVLRLQGLLMIAFAALGLALATRSFRKELR